MSSVLDEHALTALAALQRPGRPDIVQQVIGLFESESPKSITAISDGVDTADLTAIRAAAHSLKSSSAYVGATELSERCRDLECAAREDNLPGCLALSDGLEVLFDEVMSELRHYLAARAA